MKSILDPSFSYVNSTNTNVRDTWERFGFKPTTENQRRARQLRKSKPQPAKSNVREIRRKSA